MIVSLFKNLDSPKVIAQLDIQTVLEMIKNGLFSKQIEQLRSTDNTYLKYEIKKSLPTFTPHGFFDFKRGFENPKGLSGLIYFDIDDNIDPVLLTQYSFVYTYWKSLSGAGYSLIVKVDHLTVNNFYRIWDYFEDCFAANGIMVDRNTRKLVGQNIISYDPNLHVNQNCIPLDANIIESNKVGKIL